jgi:hypothetical protein
VEALVVAEVVVAPRSGCVDDMAVEEDGEGVDFMAPNMVSHGPKRGDRSPDTRIATTTNNQSNKKTNNNKNNSNNNNNKNATCLHFLAHCIAYLRPWPAI